MVKESSQKNKDIDLFSFLDLVWNGRWIVIVVTFLTTILAIIYVQQKPHEYEVSTKLYEPKNSIFLPFLTLSDVYNKLGYTINPETIFNMAINEYRDNKEIISVLSKNTYIQELMKDLDKNERSIELRKMSALFKINDPGALAVTGEIENTFTMTFMWHDIEQGRNIFEEAIDKALQNVKLTIVEDLNQLANVLEVKNQMDIDSLNIEKRVIEDGLDRVAIEVEMKLSENATIARHLGHRDSDIDFNKDGNDTPGALSLNVNNYQIPFYLNGYLAIEEELKLLKERPKDLTNYLKPGYIGVLNALNTHANYMRSTQIREDANRLKELSTDNWLNFDFNSAEIQDKDKSLLYIIGSIFFGLILSLTFLLFRKKMHSNI